MGYQRIQIKRGLEANLPTSNMLPGEIFFATDTGTLHVAIDATTRKAVVEAVNKLNVLATIDGTSDLISVYDASETSLQKVKKMTINDFRASLNIPTGSTDEKVAVVAGGASGYLWGTDGTDGVVRAGSSMAIAKASGSGYITLDVSVIDGGTF